MSEVPLYDNPQMATGSYLTRWATCVREYVGYVCASLSVSVSVSVSVSKCVCVCVCVRMSESEEGEGGGRQGESVLYGGATQECLCRMCKFTLMRQVRDRDHLGLYDQRITFDPPAT